MRPLHIRFEPSVAPWAAHLLGRVPGPARLLGCLLLLVAIATLALVLWHLQAANIELAGLQARLAANPRAQGVPKAAQTGPRMLKPHEIGAWNSVIRSLNTPWPALLDALEAGTPPDVALVSVEPDSRQGKSRLQAEAKALDALLAYAAGLKGANGLGNVALVKHETNEQDANRPVRLTFDVMLDRPDLRKAGP